MSVSLYGSGQTVLQVVQSTSSTTLSTSSTTFVNTNITASITPFSTTSKILVMPSFSVYYAAAGGGSFQIVRNGSAVYTQSTYTIYNSAGNTIVYETPVYLDSPATTSALTYTVQVLGSGSTIYVPYNNQTCSFILMEISGS